MSTSTPIPQDHPLMRAWNAHKTTPEYANSVSWAQHAEHVEGSMWALFMAGWAAAGPLEREYRRGYVDGKSRARWEVLAVVAAVLVLWMGGAGLHGMWR